MNIDDWHKRLYKHFMTLRSQRPKGLPVFAFEHGLTSEERMDLEAAIRGHIGRNAPKTSHRLSWIVYAAEVGYRYSGEEYWQTFEAETPGWAENGSRNWIRDQFRAFAEIFSGAVPRGTWAGQFSIICWPITHAILPQYLQIQLAHVLYDLRGALKPDLLESHIELGKRIELAGDRASSRFQNFHFTSAPLLPRFL